MINLPPISALGLSLVAAVANFHEAEIDMTENSPGLRIELHFPFLKRAALSMSGLDLEDSNGESVFKSSITSNG